MKVRKTALTPYTPGEMYALVADVPSYPNFLPWCCGARVTNESDGGVRATIELSYGGIERTFTTRNRLQPDKRVEMHLIDGPFERLDGYWAFDALGWRGCKVTLTLEYEFSNWVLAMVIGSVFNPIADSMVDAFYARAVAIYGQR